MPKALFSLYRKDPRALQLAQGLVALNADWGILASGGTATRLTEVGVPVEDVAHFVGGKAILGHRVVTLSREISAGLLAKAPEDEVEMAELGLAYIDLVCVDFYPMEVEINREGSTPASVIELTDIGGPTMGRSGAKGNRIVICDFEDCLPTLEWIKAGQPDRDRFINRLAAKMEGAVAGYCLASARYRSSGAIDGVVGTKVLDCCYGENRYQSPAALYSTGSEDPLAIERFRLRVGNSPSLTNLCEVDRLLQTMTHIAATFCLDGKPDIRIAVGSKHGNACGAAVAGSVGWAARNMATGDPRALFGGIVMLNFEVSSDIAEELLASNDGTKRILDGVVAPSFTEDAAALLMRKNGRCRLYENPALAALSAESLDTQPLQRRVRGGFLVQPNYTFVLNPKDPDIEKFGEVLDPGVMDMMLAWAVGSTSNSNTITLVKGGMLIGNAVGQQDRVGACKLAIDRATRAGHDTTGAIAYSDSFFPFPDGPEELHKAGISAILASSGSVKDGDVRDFCAQAGMSLWMIPDAKARGFCNH